MQLFRIAAFLLFVAAWLGGGGFGFQLEIHRLVGLVSAGLAFLAFSFIGPPAPPRP